MFECDSSLHYIVLRTPPLLLLFVRVGGAGTSGRQYRNKSRVHDKEEHTGSIQTQTQIQVLFLTSTNSSIQILACAHTLSDYNQRD